MYLRIIGLFTLLLFSFKVFSQDQNNKKYRAQQNQILIYNLALNGLIGGISGAINKEKNEKFLKVFAKNFGKGCLGGLVKYSAKQQTHYFRNIDNTLYAPINRLLFFTGHSIVMNASLNDKIFETLYFNYLGVNFKYKSTATKEERFSAKLSLGTALSALSFGLTNNKLNIYKSLEYGQFFFDLDPTYKVDNQLINGLAGYNAFAIRELNGNYFQSVVPHEMIHTFQEYDFFPISSLYKNKEISLLNKSKLYLRTSKFIDFDYEPIFSSILYLAQPKPRYYKNFFEFEAEHFSRRAYIKRY